MDDVWRLVILDGGVVVGSFLLFFLLSRTVLCLLTRSEGTEDVEKSEISNDKRKRFRTQDNRSPLESRNNSSAEFPGLLLVSVGSIAVVIAALVTTDVLAHPLSYLGQSPLTRYALLGSVGHHAYRLVACVFFDISRDRVTSVVSHVVAMIAYSSVAFTGEDTMLGISGLVYQSPFVWFVYGNRGQGRALRASLSLAATLVFLLILPTCSTGYSILKENIPAVLSLWSTSVLCLSVIYFALLGVWILVIYVRRLLMCLTAEDNGATKIESANEKTKLLVT